MHLPCLREAFASVQELVSELLSPPASRVPTGMLNTHRLSSSIPHLTLYFRFLIWIGSDQEKTFGTTITGLIYKHIEPERMILWDTKQRGGRPDTMQLIQDTWRDFGAEVIFITSNKKGNDEMMQGCRAGTFLFFPYTSSVSLLTSSSHI
jgi:hypothetical protein